MHAIESQRDHIIPAQAAAISAPMTDTSRWTEFAATAHSGA
jgi:hypothetical protein